MIQRRVTRVPLRFAGCGCVGDGWHLSGYPLPDEQDDGGRYLVDGSCPRHSEAMTGGVTAIGGSTTHEWAEATVMCFASTRRGPFRYRAATKVGVSDYVILHGWLEHPEIVEKWLQRYYPLAKRVSDAHMASLINNGCGVIG